MIGIPLRTAAGALLTLSTSAASAASFSYAEDFTGTDGSLPAGWSVLGDGAAEIEGNRLEDRGENFTTAVYTGGDAALWGDYTLRAAIGAESWSDTSSTHAAVVARVQGERVFYGVRFRGGAGGTRIEIIKNTDGGITTLGTSSRTTLLESDEVWTIELTVETRDDGVHLSANWWEDGKDPGVDAPWKTATGSDLFADPSQGVTPYLQGAAGVNSSSGGRTMFWDSFSVQGSTVPEPAGVALLGIGGLAMALRRR